jgi:predicted nucleotidyltransferase
LAVSLRTAPRTTKDVDVAVAVADDAEAEEKARDLFSFGYRTHSQLEHRETGRLSTIRLIPPPPAPPEVLVDLLLAFCGIEPEIVEAAQPIEVLPGLSVPVASIGHLIAMKLLSARPGRLKDFDDASALIGVADEQDLAVVRASIDLIDRRGFAGEKDLQKEFALLLGG